MDLSEAESVADLISSNSESSHKIAMNQMRGGFRNDINMLRERLLNFASLIELELDFSQEDVEFANTSELKNILDDIEKKLVDLIASFKTGQVIKNGIPIVIIGEPNSGKSTLLNNLLNEDRAIVSSIPGTTRDTIEDQITLNGVVCRFIDTAGIRNTIDEIESIGIEKTFKKIEEAEIIIYLIDVLDLTDEKIEFHKKYIHEIQQKYDDKHIIKVINKIDIVEDDFSKKMKALKISAKENMNINVLKESIINHIQEMTGNYESSIISNSRHYDILFKTKIEIEKVRNSIKNKVPSDLLAIDIKQALNLLGELTGEISNDEILGNIFSKFCIGK
jgi:tRNA modification GTPase